MPLSKRRDDDMLVAYYNENDPKTAAWLRELIRQGALPDGDVDDRSITDIAPSDLAPYAHCHFFAGIGGWAYALRLAGWPNNRPVWTGSCPCQPFSAAGRQKGFADIRHLWPIWFNLIRECRPSVVFGEQVANATTWFDLVSGDLEGEDYAVGTVILGAHSVGAPHIRQRLYFVADHSSTRRPSWRASQAGSRYDATRQQPSRLCDADIVADSQRRTTKRRRYNVAKASSDVEGPTQERQRIWDDSRSGFQSCGVAGTNGGDTRPEGLQRGRRLTEQSQDSTGTRLQRTGCQSRSSSAGQDRRQSRLPDHAWTACDWIPCIDNRSRPVESGTFPLAYGVPARMGRLRGYGNAIVPQVAQAFIEAYMEYRAYAPVQET